MLTSFLCASFSDDYIRVSAELSSTYSDLSQVNGEITQTESLIETALQDIGAFSDKAYPNYWSNLKTLKKERANLESQIASLESELSAIQAAETAAEAAAEAEAVSITFPDVNEPPSGPVIEPDPVSVPVEISTPPTSGREPGGSIFGDDFGFGGGGGFSGSSCFTAETILPSGKTIAKTWVDGEEKIVLTNAKYEGNVYIFLDSNGKSLLPGRITENHRILFVDGKTLPAKFTKINSKAILGSGKIVVIKKIIVQKYLGSVYNLLNDAVSFSFSDDYILTVGSSSGKLHK